MRFTFCFQKRRGRKKRGGQHDRQIVRARVEETAAEFYFLLFQSNSNFVLFCFISAVTSLSFEHSYKLSPRNIEAIFGYDPAERSLTEFPQWSPQQKREVSSLDRASPNKYDSRWRPSISGKPRTAS